MFNWYLLNTWMTCHSHCYLCGFFNCPRISEPGFHVPGILDSVWVDGWVAVGCVGLRFTGVSFDVFLSQYLQSSGYLGAASLSHIAEGVRTPGVTVTLRCGCQRAVRKPFLGLKWQLTLLLHLLSFWTSGFKTPGCSTEDSACNTAGFCLHLL